MIKRARRNSIEQGVGAKLSKSISEVRVDDNNRRPYNFWGKNSYFGHSAMEQQNLLIKILSF